MRAVQDLTELKRLDHVPEGIVPLVQALEKLEWCEPLVACDGCDGDHAAYIEVAVHGFEGVAKLASLITDLNVRFRDVIIDSRLGWNQEALDGFPEWLLFAIEIEGVATMPSPTAVTIIELAQAVLEREAVRLH